MRSACFLSISVAVALAQTVAFAQRAEAQTTTRIPFVRAVGQATVAITPDQAKIDFSVTTQSTTAQNAASTNATLTSTVITALQSVLGMNAGIRTIGYSLTALYSYPQNQPAVLIGFSATNTVEATVTDLTSVGKVIDAGIQAGATQVAGLTFGLQNPQPALAQALKLAAAQAKSNADAITSGLGMHTGAVQTLQQSTDTVPPSAIVGTTAAPVTPVQVGSVSVSATVTADFAIAQ